MYQILNCVISRPKDAHVARELEEAQQWLMEHFDTVMEKIDCNRMRGADHLFAAVVSWAVIVHTGLKGKGPRQIGK